MKVVLAAEMRDIDRKAQEEYGIPGDLLMERAALALRRECIDMLGKLSGRRIYVFCGKGNNGGDGLALARQLREKEAAVTVILTFAPDEYRGLARDNLARAEKFGVRVISLAECDKSELKQADLLVDALLGTGTSGAPSGPVAGAIAVMNSSGRPVVAVDLPSGVETDTGVVPGEAICAARTVTFGLPKPGLLLFPGASHSGTLVTADIGFPPPLLMQPSLKINIFNPTEIKEFFPTRPATAHKGITGHILILGGAPGMTGAPALSSLGALRSGAGLVTVGLRPEIVFPEKPLEVMTVTWDKVNPENYRSIVFGPGLTTGADGLEFLRSLRVKSSVPLIIDADGLNLLAGNPEYLTGWNRPVIFTPHPGEMSRLTGIPTSALQSNRLNIARRFAQTWGVVVVLKGARTITACPDGTAYINPTGNPGMATAGMGDVLAGVIAALTAQGMETGIAAATGVYLHGRAGDLASEAHGPVGIIASDLITLLPRAISEVLSSKL